MIKPLTFTIRHAQTFLSKYEAINNENGFDNVTFSRDSIPAHFSLGPAKSQNRITGS